jgi:hypothetical protein
MTFYFPRRFGEFSVAVRQLMLQKLDAYFDGCVANRRVPFPAHGARTTAEGTAGSLREKRRS